MDAYEATKIVFQRIQTLDPQNASKIMGLLLIQDHGEKDMIRLAFGPESLVHSVIVKAKKELNLGHPNMPSTPPPLSLSRQNSAPSRQFNLPSPLSITTSDFQNPDDLMQVYSNSSTSPSGMNSGAGSGSGASPFYGNGGEIDLIDELQLQDQLSFLNDGPKGSDFFYQDSVFSPTGNDQLVFQSYPWVAGHRRSCSVSDIYAVDDPSGGLGWKPCLFYARGYCKNGSNCRFLHGGDGNDGGATTAEQQQCQELLRSKSTLASSTNFPYSPLAANKCINYLLHHHQIPSEASRALMMGDGMHKFGRGRAEFGLNGVNPGSRQIYLTFPADSTFKEEDVSNYFSNFGPVQDVRIPYQQKRMFGFVTFEYPETVKLILAKGNPHFVCDARVLVKPYKEKGKIPDKHRKQQQQMERGEFNGCGSPTGLEYDVPPGARMFYNTQDMLWRRKLEEADLHQTIELQNRRLMGLQLLDVKRNSHQRAFSTGTVISSSPYSPLLFNQNVVPSNLSSPESTEENCPIGMIAKHVDDEQPPPPEISTENEQRNTKESDSLDHNLPDSPFALREPISAFSTTATVDTEKGGSATATGATMPTTNNLITGSAMFPATSIDTSPFKSCYFQVPRFASSRETIGM